MDDNWKEGGRVGVVGRVIDFESEMMCCPTNIEKIICKSVAVKKGDRNFSLFYIKVIYIIYVKKLGERYVEGRGPYSFLFFNGLINFGQLPLPSNSFIP